MLEEPVCSLACLQIDSRKTSNLMAGKLIDTPPLYYSREPDLQGAHQLTVNASSVLAALLLEPTVVPLIKTPPPLFYRIQPRNCIILPPLLLLVLHFKYLPATGRKEVLAALLFHSSELQSEVVSNFNYTPEVSYAHLQGPSRTRVTNQQSICFDLSHPNISHKHCINVSLLNTFPLK